MEMRLMVETDTPTDRTIAANGTHWMLTEPLDISSNSIPPYACASYVWGESRVPNPIHPSITMSDRTHATFAAVARHAPGRAIWIDAFCVPVEPAKKRPTLESLGYIFSRADCVVAVLAPESLAALTEMQAFLALKPRPADIPDTPLKALDTDQWIRSVWTYQEVVNCSRTVYFVSTVCRDAPMTGIEVFQAVGEYLTRYGNYVGERPFHWMYIHFRHVLDFEQLLSDWFTSGYLGRSALLIMCGLDARAAISPANYFYSMIGALTNKPSSRTTSPTLESLAERFMELCEEKGDYSFIFSSAPRDTRPGRRWRPSPGLLKPILTWHNAGSGQPGRRTEHGVILENVTVLTEVYPNGHVSHMHAFQSVPREVIEGWLRHPSEGADLPSLLHSALTGTLRFSGSGGWFATDFGVFYAQDKLPDGLQVTMCVSRDVNWVFGAPGIAMVTTTHGPQYTPGVFVGDVKIDAATCTEFLLE